MGLFSKKKTENFPPQISEPEAVVESLPDISIPEPPQEEPSMQTHGMSKELAKVESFSAEIEKLKAQAEANTELRQIFSEKFTRIDEEIGELRSMLVEREKDMKTLEIQATKASDLVLEVQPEKLMVEAKRMEAKIEALKGKLDSHEQINETMMQEFKDIRNSIRAFRGVKEIEKMTKDLLDDQTVLRKIEAQVEQHSDKVESMFMEMNKRYEEIRRLKDVSDNLNQNFAKVASEVNEMRVRFPNMASKEEFLRLRQDIETVTKPLKYDEQMFEKMLLDLKNLQKDVLPMMRKYQTLSEQQDFAIRDFDNFKKIIQEKVDEKLKNYEGIIIRLEKQTSVLSHQNDAFLHKFDSEIERLKDIKKMMNAGVSNFHPTDVMISRIQKLEDDNKQLTDAIKRIALLFKKVLDKNKEQQILN